MGYLYCGSGLARDDDLRQTTDLGNPPIPRSSCRAREAAFEDAVLAALQRTDFRYLNLH